MSDGDDYLYELGYLSHKPLNEYPRKDMAAETIFAREWERLMRNTGDRYYDRYFMAPNASLAR